MDTSLRNPVVYRTHSPRDAWHWAQGLWQRWRRRVRTRAELREMDARALTDIGMDPETARQETRKFFWQS
jgi:uncharacterized protein YjiS (DUF1127 family)